MPTGPEFPTDVDWMAIKPELANRILSLPPATARATHELSYIAVFADDEPDQEPWFSHRRERCSELQRDARELSQRLRQVTRLSPASNSREQ